MQAAKGNGLHDLMGIMIEIMMVAEPSHLAVGVLLSRARFLVRPHSFAHIAQESGAESSAIKNILGHSNLATTERYMGSFDTSKPMKPSEMYLIRNHPSSIKLKNPQRLRRNRLLNY